jgi:hypothetical protein
VYAGFNVEGGGRGRPVMKVLAQDVAVLKAPKDTSGGVSGSNGQVTLRLNEAIAANVAFAVDNGKVWMALRPGGAQAAKPRLVTMESLLFGVPTVNVRRAVRGR